MRRWSRSTRPAITGARRRQDRRRRAKAKIDTLRARIAGSADFARSRAELRRPEHRPTGGRTGLVQLRTPTAPISGRRSPRCRDGQCPRRSSPGGLAHRAARGYATGGRDRPEPPRRFAGRSASASWRNPGATTCSNGAAAYVDIRPADAAATASHRRLTCVRPRLALVPGEPGRRRPGCARILAGNAPATRGLRRRGPSCAHARRNSASTCRVHAVLEFERGRGPRDRPDRATPPAVIAALKPPDNAIEAASTASSGPGAQDQRQCRGHRHTGTTDCSRETGRPRRGDDAGAPGLRVALATTHLLLRAVADAISRLAGNDAARAARIAANRLRHRARRSSPCSASTRTRAGTACSGARK